MKNEYRQIGSSKIPRYECNVLIIMILLIVDLVLYHCDVPYERRAGNEHASCIVAATTHTSIERAKMIVEPACARISSPVTFSIALLNLLHAQKCLNVLRLLNLNSPRAVAASFMFDEPLKFLAECLLLRLL